jgi:hypothetical protein
MWRTRVPSFFTPIPCAPYIFFFKKNIKNRCTPHRVDTHSLRVCVGTMKISMILKYTGILYRGQVESGICTQLRCYATYAIR